MLQTLDTASFTVSVGYILTTALLMRLARLVLFNTVASKYYQSIFLEFIATFELLATCFEFGVVIETHGFLAYTGLMLVMFNYWGSAWHSATAAPHPHILDILQRNDDIKSSLSKILAQLASAALVYTIYVKPIWSFGYRSTHLERIQASRCFTHLQVPVAIGVLVEAVASFAFNIALQSLGSKSYNFLSLPLALVSIVYAGMTYTGCYFNPILASTIQFGCEGISWKEHLLVYWCGPILGSIGFTLFNKLKDSSNNNKKLK